MADVFYDVDRDLTIQNACERTFKVGGKVDLMEWARATKRQEDGRKFESRQARQEARQAKREAQEQAEGDEALLRAAEELGIDLSGVHSTVQA